MDLMMSLVDIHLDEDDIRGAVPESVRVLLYRSHRLACVIIESSDHPRCL